MRHTIYEVMSVLLDAYSDSDGTELIKLCQRAKINRYPLSHNSPKNVLTDIVSHCDLFELIKIIDTELKEAPFSNYRKELERAKEALYRKAINIDDSYLSSLDLEDFENKIKAHLNDAKAPYFFNFYPSNAYHGCKPRIIERLLNILNHNQDTQKWEYTRIFDLVSDLDFVELNANNCYSELDISSYGGYSTSDLNVILEKCGPLLENSTFVLIVFSDESIDHTSFHKYQFCNSITTSEFKGIVKNLEYRLLNTGWDDYLDPIRNYQKTNPDLTLTLLFHKIGELAWAIHREQE